MPPGVKEVRLRSDTAGYQHNLLRYCDQGEDERFGRIEFAICSAVTPEFKKAAAEVGEADWQGEPLIHWQPERCGKSEEAHAVMKDDLAGGKFPSGDFGEHAAWWWVMVLAHNLNATMKKQV